LYNHFAVLTQRMAVLLAVRIIVSNHHFLVIASFTGSLSI